MKARLLVLALHVAFGDFPEARQRLEDDLVEIPNEFEDELPDFQSGRRFCDQATRLSSTRKTTMKQAKDNPPRTDSPSRASRLATHARRSAAAFLSSRRSSPNWSIATRMRDSDASAEV
jgi:hypothetical protein